jgi:hypothetical protein
VQQSGYQFSGLHPPKSSSSLITPVHGFLNDPDFEDEEGNIVYLSPIEQSNVSDSNFFLNFDYDQVITEVPDEKLLKLGFPLPTEASTSAGKAGSGRSGLSYSEIDSPFIHFTSRKTSRWA